MNFPHRLGKYRIDALLGQGAMGVVYRAFDTEIDREVAIKILHAQHLQGEMGEELQQRFVHEVKAAARCQHPNIVTVYDYGVNEKQPYMVMEYIKGIDLQVFLKSKQTLSIQHAINLILKVLDALHNAHSLGIVHRDIKPANIMLLDNGQIKVTDFGVARLENSDLTQVGDLVGTPSYMSPEAREGDTVTLQSDLYASALVLLELLLNKRLKNKEITYSRLQSELALLPIAATVQTTLADVLNKALQREPQQRYADAMAFSKALSSCLDTANDAYQIADDLATQISRVKSDLPIASETDDNPLFADTSPSSTLLHSQLTVVEKNLAHYLGPVAKMLVKKQAKNAGDMQTLIQTLISHIPSESERERFISSLDVSLNLSTDTSLSNRSSRSMPSTAPIHFSDDYLERVTRALLPYLGPVAKHLVKATAKKADSQAALCQSLADKIPNPQERADFLKKCNDA